ncbi:MAG: hypothetical protein WC819_02090 [Parcubacteria group bacterium]|jgi:hypothetical protein
MKRILVISFLVWLLPHMLLAATVTQDTLKGLDVVQSAWSSLLSSDTAQWKNGKIGSASVRYTVKGDVIGYDEKNRTWWRLITPVSTEVPITALAISVNSSGAATRQIVTLEAGEQRGSAVSQEIAQPRVQPPPVPKQEVIARAPEKVVIAKPETLAPSPSPVVKTVQVVEKKDAVVEKPQKVSKPSKVAQQENNAVIKVASTWDFMKEYQRQIGR